MRVLIVPMVLIALAAAGCDSTAAGGTGAAGTGSTGASGAGTGAGTGSSASTSTGSGGSSGSGGAGGSSTLGPSVTLTMDAFDVPAGAEVYKCQNWKNPFGMDVEVGEFESHMSTGSHHMLLFYVPVAEDGPLEDCSGLEFEATPYGAQEPDFSVTFPAGIAALVPGSTGLRIQAHYLNTTPDDDTAKVTMTMHLAKPGTVTQQAGVLFVPNLNIDIPPGATQTVSYQCHLPFDMNLLQAWSHMHRHGKSFEASIDGTTIYQTMDWSSPVPAVFHPALPEKQGAQLDFDCLFENDSASTLTFGESALTNEMCIFTGLFYPVPAGSPPTVDCE